MKRSQPGPDEDDVALGQLVAGRRERLLDVAAPDRVAVRAAVEVEDDAGAEEPVERQLVDRLRRRPAIVEL